MDNDSSGRVGGDRLIEHVPQIHRSSVVLHEA